MTLDFRRNDVLLLRAPRWSLRREAIPSRTLLILSSLALFLRLFGSDASESLSELVFKDGLISGPKGVEHTAFPS
jgi:hypothetical protein